MLVFPSVKWPFCGHIVNFEESPFSDMGYYFIIYDNYSYITKRLSSADREHPMADVMSTFSPAGQHSEKGRVHQSLRTKPPSSAGHITA
jgi:hypothetical protein